MIREDAPDLLYDTLDEKHEAVLGEILEMRGKGRPVLVGSTSVRESEQISRRLKKAGVPHQVLNAKNHRAEAAVIAQAGRQGAVTISTNMAGRGTDILLGGNPEAMASDLSPDALARLRETCARERDEVVQAGGLHVVGTARHEARRIDDQLRGRAGRQGDPGSSRFFLSLDDEIWQKFGRGDIEEARRALAARGHRRGEPVTWPRVRRLLGRLQDKVEQENFAVRRDVLKYDLVVHAQRETIYGWRSTLVGAEGFDPEDLVADLVADLCARHGERAAVEEALHAHFHASFELPSDPGADLAAAATEEALALLRRREEAAGREVLRELGRRILLAAIDDFWTEHLTALERLEEGIGLRAYAEVDPIIPWRRETAAMWEELLFLIRSRAVTLWFLAEIAAERRRAQPHASHRRTRR
jgi:preprotein translocase subunit SecA